MRLLIIGNDKIFLEILQKPIDDYRYIDSIYLVNGTTSVHKKPMKDIPKKAEVTAENQADKPAEKPVVVATELHREIYLRLVASAAADGRFLLGNLPNANAVVKQGDHLRGVSELLAKCFEK